MQICRLKKTLLPALNSLMAPSTPYLIGLVSMALTFYTVMVMAVSTLIFGLFYLFFYQPTQLLKEASASSSSDDESKLQKKKMKPAKKNKKRKSAKTKEPGSPGEGLDLDVTLDKTGKKAVKTNVVHPYIFGIRIPDCTVS